MRADEVVAGLRARGELWEPAEGMVGLRGEALRLQSGLGEVIARRARHGSGEEWQVPPGLALEALARAGVLQSFPQWLTLASHLSGGELGYEAVASAEHPEERARSALAPTGTALPSAACWHCYAALAGTRLEGRRRITLQATCFRHEAGRFAPLERNWAFTMREVVCLGTNEECNGFLEAWIDQARALALALGLRTEVESATDPFFAPTARGKLLSQRLNGLKRELVAPLGDGRKLALFSANRHEAWFGDAFAIEQAEGGPAWSACAAFGLERWLLALLVEHGLSPQAWPKEAFP